MRNITGHVTKDFPKMLDVNGEIVMILKILQII